MHIGQRCSRVAAIAALIGLDALMLIRLEPMPAGLGTDLSHPRQWVARVGSDEAALQLARTGLWVAAGWLALALVVAALATAPGRIGTVGRAATGWVLPRAMQRLIAGSLGAGVALVPVAAVAGPVSAPSVAWPSDDRPLPRVEIPWPQSPVRATPAGPTTTVTAPSPSPSPSPGSGPVDHTGRRVTIRAGDSLWTVAAHELGPAASAARIRDRWPAWYRANRAVIGPDPDLIRPGQLLTEPTSTAAGS